MLVLYAAYELLRGLGDSSVHVARDHASDIVALERLFNVFIEQAVQDWAATIPTLPGFLGAFYVTMHLGATAVALVWLYRSHPARFPLVRNTLVFATAISLVGYVVYPAAPPRLSGHGFVDTVSVAHAREPQLGPAREPLQPVRGRPEHALRLLADRGRRPRRVRTASCRPHRRRALPAFHALRHRRDGKPLPVRRSDGRPRRPRRLGHRTGARPLPGSAGSRTARRQAARCQLAPSFEQPELYHQPPAKGATQCPP